MNRNTNENFSFGSAIELLKQGKLVTRSGWNGKNMYLLLIKGNCVSEIINDCYGDPQEEPIPVSDAIYMKTADNKLVPWLASQTDVLAEDWKIV